MRSYSGDWVREIAIASIRLLEICVVCNSHLDDPRQALTSAIMVGKGSFGGKT
jgi:hypothetical protein